MYTSPRNNRGVALITALLVVALATTAAVTLASNVQLHIRRSANLIDGDQAALYAKGAEGWAKTILSSDLKDNQTDDRDDQWATKLPIPIDVPGGFVFGQIEDLQGRFNINDLLDFVAGASQQNPNQPPPGPNHAAVARFQELLNYLNRDPKLADVVLDWIDADISEEQDGAEDNYYSGLELPYLAANQPMLDITELRLVKGFEVILDEETGETVYDRVLPHVTALPPPSKININFASPEVLASLHTEIDLKLAEEDLYRDPEDAVNKGPFDNVEDFLILIPTDTNFTPQKREQEIEPLITVETDYFLATAEATIGNGRATFTSILQRDGPTQIKTVFRGQKTQ